MTYIKTSSNFILVLSLLLLLLLHFSTDSGNAVEDFHQWCRKTMHSQICISIIAESPDVSAKTSPAGFCLILNDKARDIAGSVLGNISDILKDSAGVSSADEQLLQDAYALYVDIDYIVYNLYFSVLNHENYLSYSKDLRKVIYGVDKSKAIFSKLSAQSSLFGEENEMLGFVIDTMLQILNLNECKKIQPCSA